MIKSQSETSLNEKYKRIRVKTSDSTEFPSLYLSLNGSFDTSPVEEKTNHVEDEDKELENKGNISVKKLKYVFESIFYDSFSTDNGIIYKTSYNNLFWVLLFAIFSNFCWIIYFLFFNSGINEEDEEL